MITHIEGNICELTPTYVVLDCNGIGYFINISLTTFSKLESSINKKIRLFTHLNMEKILILYGFLKLKSVKFFDC